MSRLRPVLALALAAASLSACAQLKAGRTSAPVAVAPVAPPQPQAPHAAPKPVASAPQPRTCVPRALAPPPRYPDTDAALRDAAGAADRYQLLAAGRLMRQRRLEELERVIAACR